ncbi:Bifunctional acetylxylan esterase/xylanase XynS20E [Lasiodiplodia hormozganensis]|uniref:Bifunctional acetylxylan esterase/xylanase XynS20E n=1 Tax=Lasiodiplodia hormozganensis TaxID=869390 RepID=A0AA39YN49_9PEZI|nr:Bifunctional acetylxylan esterase/xylanase XynS20E [Lasiodiplodia hormozganensis]
MPHSQDSPYSFLKLKDPGHEYANTKHISFLFAQQTLSAATFGYDFFLSLPPDYTALTDKKWPLIIFLHGAGESQRGPNESYACLRHGIPKIILCYDKLKDGSDPSVSIPMAERLRSRKSRSDLSATPVPPDVCRQVAEEFVTLTPVLDMDNGYGWNETILTSLLDEVLPHLRIDLQRVHLTGFSMGGGGTWELALHTPNRFATLTPICGYGDTLRASQIARIPQWVHHGERDDIIDISRSERMVTALEKAGADVKFSRYPDLAHDSWTETYNNMDLWTWMLAIKSEAHVESEILPEGDKATVS